MLNLTWQDFLLRGLPEEFLLVFGVYAFSKTIVNMKRYVISSICFLIIAYVIRLMPIQYGVHTILSLIGMIVITTSVNKIPIIKAIQASIIIVILEFMCERINIFIIEYFFKVNIKNIINEPSLKILYGIPSLLIFACIVFSYYYTWFRRKRLREVTYGEIS